jgi:hypothetical protein
MHQLSVDVDNQVAVSVVEFLQHKTKKLTTNGHE